MKKDGTFIRKKRELFKQNELIWSKFIERFLLAINCYPKLNLYVLLSQINAFHENLSRIKVAR